ncbi:MAG: FtsW/RodA/SpoVE family cell cycle protein [Eubacterium sp.]|nr:FtsW/RodA/SpoVE family cell cycle protein [Eubacterium sp.]
MVHFITELSKYLMIILFAAYAFSSYVVLKYRDGGIRSQKLYRWQVFCMFFIHLDAFAVIFAQTQEIKVLVFYAAQVAFILFMFLIYKIIYKRSAKILVNHMCMLMIIGFIILTRLDFENALRQFEIACAAAVLSIFVPLLIRKLKVLRKFTWIYAVIGIGALGAVFALGATTYGAKLSFTIAGITVQPSEFIKIVFVFFCACMLFNVKEFKRILITTIVAAIHVLILVASTDLGAALIFFITYIVMLYVATRNPIYLFGGLGVGALAAVAASKVFSHVRVRIIAWKDPFSVIDSQGYQIAHSLFAIGTGGWAGMGLFQGMPEKIPVNSSDFVFAVISEEMGGIFAICVILVCFSCYLMTLNVAMQIKDSFYKLIALGLGTVYGFQVFLCIGGVIKFIPLTGVTLPFISSGGSSLLCTIIMFAIIQGLYILRQDEGDADERSKVIETVNEKKSKSNAGYHRPQSGVRSEVDFKVGPGSPKKQNPENKAKYRSENCQKDRSAKKPEGRRRRSGFDNDIEELW